MPHTVEAHVEQQLEMLMPILPHPAPYWRYPNATEAYRASLRSASGRHMAPPTPPTSAGGSSATGGTTSVAASTGAAPAANPLAPPVHALGQNPMSHSMANAFASTVSPRRQSGGGSSGSFHVRGDGAMERVLTDDSGLQLLQSVVTGETEAGAVEPRTLEAEQLAVRIYACALRQALRRPRQFAQRALSTTACLHIIRNCPSFGRHRAHAWRARHAVPSMSITALSHSEVSERTTCVTPQCMQIFFVSNVPPPSELIYKR